MTEPHDFSDEVLTAYIDKEVDPPTRAAIERALRSDPVLADRLEALQVPVADVKQAFASLLNAAPAPPDLPARQPMATRRGGTGVALAASLALGVILGVGVMSLRPAQPSGWMGYVAAYQALYVNGTLADVVDDPDATAADLSALSATLGYDMSQAEHVSRLDFKRGQILGYEGKPLVQLAYLSPTGAPVALCVIQSDDARRSGVSVARLEGMAAAHWQKDGFAFLLIGGQDQALIAEAAQQMAERL